MRFPFFKITWFYLVFMIFGAVWPLLAQSEPKSDELIRKGFISFKEQRYLEAIDHFKKAYEISPNPLRLQNMARCYELLKQYPSAISHYIQFYLTVDNPADKTDTQKRLQNLILSYGQGPATLTEKEVERLLSQVYLKTEVAKVPEFLVIFGLSYLKNALWEKALRYLDKGFPAFGPPSPLHRPMAQWLEKARSEWIGWLIQQGDRSVDLKAYPAAILIYLKGLGQNPSLALKIKLQERILKVRSLLKLQEITRITVIKEDPLVKKNKILGWSLASVGIVSLAASIILCLQANRSRIDANDYYQKSTALTQQYASNPQIKPELEDTLSRYDTSSQNYIAYGVIGGVLMAGAVTALTYGIYALLKFKPKKTAAHLMQRFSIQPTPDRNGAFLNYQFLGSR